MDPATGERIYPRRRAESMIRLHWGTHFLGLTFDAVARSLAGLPMRAPGTRRNGETAELAVVLPARSNAESMVNFEVIHSGEGFRASAAAFTAFTRFLMPADRPEALTRGLGLGIRRARALCRIYVVQGSVATSPEWLGRAAYTKICF